MWQEPPSPRRCYSRPARGRGTRSWAARTRAGSLRRPPVCPADGSSRARSSRRRARIDPVRGDLLRGAARHEQHGPRRDPLDQAGSATATSACRRSLAPPRSGGRRRAPPTDPRSFAAWASCGRAPPSATTACSRGSLAAASISTSAPSESPKPPMRSGSTSGRREGSRGRRPPPAGRCRRARSNAPRSRRCRGGRAPARRSRGGRACGRAPRRARDCRPSRGRPGRAAPLRDGTYQADRARPSAVGTVTSSCGIPSEASWISQRGAWVISSPVRAGSRRAWRTRPRPRASPRRGRRAAEAPPARRPARRGQGGDAGDDQSIPPSAIPTPVRSRQSGPELTT